MDPPPCMRCLVWEVNAKVQYSSPIYVVQHNTSPMHQMALSNACKHVRHASDRSCIKHCAAVRCQLHCTVLYLRGTCRCACDAGCWSAESCGVGTLCSSGFMQVLYSHTCSMVRKCGWPKVSVDNKTGDRGFEPPYAISRCFVCCEDRRTYRCWFIGPES